MTKIRSHLGFRHTATATADGWEEVVHRSDDEDADVMTAITAIKQTEAQLQSHLANHIAANGAEVVFCNSSCHGAVIKATHTHAVAMPSSAVPRTFLSFVPFSSNNKCLHCKHLSHSCYPCMLAWALAFGHRHVERIPKPQQCLTLMHSQLLHA